MPPPPRAGPPAGPSAGAGAARVAPAAAAAGAGEAVPCYVGQRWAVMHDAFMGDMERTGATTAQLPPWCLVCPPDGPPPLAGGASASCYACLTPTAADVESVVAHLSKRSRRRIHVKVAVPARGPFQVGWRDVWTTQQPELSSWCGAHQPAAAAEAVRQFEDPFAAKDRPKDPRCAFTLQRTKLTVDRPLDGAMLLVADETAARVAVGDGVADFVRDANRWRLSAPRAVVVVLAVSASESDAFCRALSGHAADAETCDLPIFTVCARSPDVAPTTLLAYLQHRHAAAFAKSVVVVGGETRMNSSPALSVGAATCVSIADALSPTRRAAPAVPSHSWCNFLNHIVAVGDAAAGGGEADALVAEVERTRRVPREAWDRDTPAVRHRVVLLRTTVGAQRCPARAPVVPASADGSAGPARRAGLPAERWPTSVAQGVFSKDQVQAGKALLLAGKLIDYAVLSDEGGVLGVRGAVPLGNSTGFMVELQAAARDGAVVKSRCACAPNAGNAFRCRHLAALWFMHRDRCFP